MFIPFFSDSKLYPSFHVHIVHLATEPGDLSPIGYPLISSSKVQPYHPLFCLLGIRGWFPLYLSWAPKTSS